MPDAKLIAVVRDPIDRAYSNWMHLWSDGLEPIADFEAACDAESDRITAGWAPFWHYRRLGLYGEQLEHLLTCFPREQVHVVRYRDLVDRPAASLDRDQHVPRHRPTDAIDVPGRTPGRSCAPDSRRVSSRRSCARVHRSAATSRPQVWRRASVPLLWALHANGTARPPLPAHARRVLVDYYADDVRRLSAITGDDYTDWLGEQGRGEYSARIAVPVT